MALVLLVGLVLGSSLAGRVVAVAEAEAVATGTGERVVGGAGGEGGGGGGLGSESLPELPEADGKGIPLTVGSSVKLEELGPVVVTEECMLRRIANWDVLTEREQKVAWRRISQRNNVRLEECKRARTEGSPDSAEETPASGSISSPTRREERPASASAPKDQEL